MTLGLAAGVSEANPAVSTSTMAGAGSKAAVQPHTQHILTREADACGFLIPESHCGFWWGSSFSYELSFHKVSTCCRLSNEIIMKSYVRPGQSDMGPEVGILFPGEFNKIAQNQRFILMLTPYLTQKVVWGFYNNS